MPITNHIEAFESLRKQVQNARVQAIAEAATQAADQIENRIFDKAQNVDASSDRKPEYSEGHAKKRLSAGLQIVIVDYEFTGQLRSEFSLDIRGDGVAVLSIDGQRAKVSRYLEQRRGKAFAADSRDKALMESVLLAELAKFLA